MRRRLADKPGWLLVLLAVSLGAWAAPHHKSDWPVPEEAMKLKNPLPNTAATIEAGKALYLDKCAHCHGDAGDGQGLEAALYSVKPADFTDAHMMDEMTDGELFWKLSEGRRPMPGFKKQLTQEQRWQLVAFIRTFAKKPAAPPAAAPKPAPHKHH